MFFWSTIYLAIHAMKDRRDLFDGKIILQQFSMLRHLQVPPHILDSACSTMWLALAMPCLETLSISPCKSSALYGLCDEGGADGYKSYEDLISVQLKADWADPFFGKTPQE
jgi:hypothetical protein